MTRRALLATASAAIIMLGLSVIVSFDAVFIWNRTDSVPKGLYRLTAAPLERGALVAYRPSREESDWLVAHGVTGSDWMLLKHVAGLPGDELCFEDGMVTAPGGAWRVSVDTPVYPGWVWSDGSCLVLGADEVFLANTHARSVDGRIFGPQKIDRIAGTAISLFTYGDVGGKTGNQVLREYSGVKEGMGFRRARFKHCLPAGAKPLSAHLFLGSTGGLIRWQEKAQPLAPLPASHDR